MDKVWQSIYGDEGLATLNQLSREELYAFGFADAKGEPRKLGPLIREKALAMVRLKLKGRPVKFNIEKEGESTMEKTQVAKVEPEPETKLATREPEPIVITSGALGDLAKAITESVGAVLHNSVDSAIAVADEYKTVANNEEYVRAVNHRKTLKALVTTKGDPSDPNRLRVRVTLGILDAAGQRIAVAAETTIGTLSVEDLYGPVATLLDKLHKATTQGRSDATERIEEARRVLEISAIAWQEKLEAERREAERLDRERKAQEARTSTAQHWVGLLTEHGYTRESCLALLEHPIESVTPGEVAMLEKLLREKLLAEEEEKQKAELDDAIATARSMGMEDVAKELEGQADIPVVVPAPAPPPPVRVSAPSVAATATPKVKGVGRRTAYTIKITNPKLIPAAWLLPTDDHLYDPEAYTRLRAAARAQGEQLNVPGVEVVPETKLTQR